MDVQELMQETESRESEKIGRSGEGNHVASRPPVGAAIEYAEQGWSVFPLHSVTVHGRCSCGSTTCGSPGKHPRTPHGFKDATTDMPLILEWWNGEWPDANIGIRTGAASGLAVLDVDEPAAIDRLRQCGELPRTRIVITGRGRHFYFRHPGAPLRPRVALMQGVDLRADDAYVVAPPSVHASGVRYRFDDPQADIADMPEWLLKLVTELNVPMAASAGVFKEGERNTRLASVGGSLARQGITGNALDTILSTTNRETCDPPLPQPEVARVARSMERYVGRSGSGSAPDADTERGQVLRSGTGDGRNRFKLFSIADVLSLPSPEWRVEGLLPVRALSMIYAPQEQFKTFFGLDVALSVAHGTDFHGRKVKRGPTAYILGEGRGGLKNRVRAWIYEHGIQDVEGAFFVLEAVQFRRPADVDALKAEIEARNLKPEMLFIDTFARCAVGVDENDAMHVGEWIDAVTALQQAMGVDVVALHHAQKPPADDTKGKRVRERGSSAFIGAVDTVIRLKKGDGRVVTVSCEKQKDAAHFEPFTLRVKVLDLGTDEHGQPASSCVLVACDAASEIPGNGFSQQHRTMLKALTDFPDEKADRGAWMQKTSLTDRSFDRHRKALQTHGHIEPVERGVYKITKKGLATIDTESPTANQASVTQDVAATPPPPRGGEVATGLATGTSNNDLEEAGR